MRMIDPYERGVPNAFDRGELKSVATKAEVAKFKSAARATAIKDRRISIRLSSGDLSDIQVRALEEGVPYQTLIASVLHKHVTGGLAERTRNVLQHVPSRCPSARLSGAQYLLVDWLPIAADAQPGAQADGPVRGYNLVSAGAARRLA